MGKDILYRRSTNSGSTSRNNSSSASRSASEPKRPPPVSFAVRVGGPPLSLPNAAAHAAAAQDFAKRAVHHAGMAAQMSRDSMRERPRKR